MEAILIHCRGCRKIAEVIMTGKKKDACGAIMIEAEASGSPEVPPPPPPNDLSLYFSMFLVNHDLLRVR